MPPPPRPFTFAVHSRDRAAGTAVAYTLTQSREIVGDWRVTARVTPFAANITDTTLELLVRAAGICNDSSDPSFGWCSVLTMVPAQGHATEGVFVVNGGLRGPLEIKWVNAATGAEAGVTNCEQHAIHLYFDPL